jgi:hypothetical protein
MSVEKEEREAIRREAFEEAAETLLAYIGDMEGSSVRMIAAEIRFLGKKCPLCRPPRLRRRICGTPTAAKSADFCEKHLSMSMKQLLNEGKK